MFIVVKNAKKRKNLRNPHLRKISTALIVTLLFAAAGTLLLFKTFAADEVAGEWQVLCDVHHLGADDPIVYPNQPGKSHMHSFMGNVSTNANTTTESLMANRSSCGRNMETTDRSAYWVPSVYIKQPDGSLKLAPTGGQYAFIYYERLGGVSGPKVLPFPVGFRMIAGTATATTPQPLSVVAWGCGGGGGGPQTAHIPHCSDPSQPLHGSLFFPSCWNGRDLDSADHKSHMAYAGAGGRCPATHPVSLPRLNFQLDYEGVTGGPDHVLASGGQYSMHGDFFNGWDVRVQNALVSECLNTPRSCIGIERQGETIIKPAYDPDPIPVIQLSNFSSTPLTTGTMPNISPPASPPAAKPTPKSTASSSGSSSSAQTASSADQTAEGHSAAHGEMVNASYDPAISAKADAKVKAASASRVTTIKTILLVVAFAGLGVLGYALYRIRYTK